MCKRHWKTQHECFKCSSIIGKNIMFLPFSQFAPNVTWPPFISSILNYEANNLVLQSTKHVAYIMEIFVREPLLWSVCCSQDVKWLCLLPNYFNSCLLLFTRGYIVLRGLLKKFYFLLRNFLFVNGSFFKLIWICIGRSSIYTQGGKYVLTHWPIFCIKVTAQVKEDLVHWKRLKSLQLFVRTIKV